ncbi:hypothetical protein CFHF_04360 [Caulobacter flavus]|uniref:Uncharacterized protein n=1 Tax=Caulobacter flavus TaxID=1679497 RepID=A0A2N5CZK5_9CAUL|nr:hypothetical protein [Caulobacter flavus]AYV45079.1 hypothetical protein C1707_01810 [Caulobacter flavus]PLR19240.1 hypothetical protein CFHF_04360 [Caulobacter flavus]
MDVYEFVSADDLAQAPEDPTAAFAYFVGIAQRRLKESIRSYPDENDTWRMIQDDKFNFHNYVIGVAKAYKVDPFQDMEVPDPEGYDHTDIRRFETDLAHFMTQLVHGNAIRDRRDSVTIPDTLKDRLRSHVAALQTAIDNNDGLTEAKKVALHAKLREFLEALDSNRVPIWKLTTILVGAMSIGANVVQFIDSPSVQKVVTTMWTTIAEAKAASDEQRRLPSNEPPQILLPPRRPRPKLVRERFSADLDDEIPF